MIGDWMLDGIAVGVKISTAVITLLAIAAAIAGLLALVGYITDDGSANAKDHNKRDSKRVR